MKQIAWVLLVIVSFGLIAEPSGPVQERARPVLEKPKLVLVIVADQFRYDYLMRFREQYTEGLQRMLTRGAVFTDARYEHFPTYTSVGHAAILTGAFPSVNGIIGNTWFDRRSGKPVPSAADDSVKLVGGAGEKGASPRNLLVSTLGDEIKMAGQGQNRVIGMSMKDYAGILATGRMADAVYWFEGASGNFVSSSYYFPDLPAWVKEFNAKRLADRYAGREWQGIQLSSEKGSALYRMLPSMPFGSELLEELAEAAIEAEQLGRDAETDLLVMSFSSNDYIGHFYGPDAAQVRSISLETDRLIGKLLRYIDAQIGLSNVTVVFTADHGVAPMPEVNAKRKMPGGRIASNVVSGAIKKRLEETYGPGEWIAATPEDAIYLNWEFIRSRKLALEEVTAEAARAAQEVPGVFRVYTRTQLSSGNGIHDRIGRRVMHGFSTSRGADLYVLLEPYYFYGTGKTTTHGSPFSYDNHVPLIIMGPGIAAGRYHQPVAINDLAPTLAAILDIETPSGSEGRILSEIFAGNP